jgi:hypothetical protein
MKKRSTSLSFLFTIFTCFSLASCGSSSRNVPTIRVSEPTDRQSAAITFYNLSSFSACTVPTISGSNGKFTLSYNIKETNIPIEINEDNKNSFLGWTASIKSNVVIKTVTKDHYKEGSSSIIELFPLVTSVFTLRLVLPYGDFIDIPVSGYLGRSLFDDSSIAYGKEKLTLSYINSMLKKYNKSYSFVDFYESSLLTNVTTLVPCSFKNEKYDNNANLIVYGMVSENVY